jgi:imidazolonepropionase-like amidohydrolase
MMKFKLLAKIMPMTSIIQSATSKPSEMMGVADNVGTIAPDKLADMVILQRDPLENPNNVSSIDAVILRGQLLTRKRLDELLDRAAAGTISQPPR